jgi:hypothetical protein
VRAVGEKEPVKHGTVGKSRRETQETKWSRRGGNGYARGSLDCIRRAREKGGQSKKAIFAIHIVSTSKGEVGLLIT